ncbi:HAMP domain-containing sensor histidine kinase [Nocardioides sp.]|uniref:HAMP domain-containing sensor histidine kinase n=1 Tax=Nocardioides sp. TaxID=35761 RepID=UPI002B998CE0|nr:HAMP domain-containing sensor histidine kinase [Nocardioides sp.]HSX68672.1 HAMP domain-containing sensor histidine kinase [Nocardioides sp.]
MSGDLSLPLFWRVCLINGAVFALATTALAFSPATVSARPLLSEAIVLTCGFIAICVLNGLLLRSVLRPLDRFTTVMASVDMRHPGRRLNASGGPAGALVDHFNQMLQRLEDERAASTLRALAAQEAERERIARELHDEVGQSLTAVLLALKQASTLAPAEVAGELDVARETTRASLEEVRRISQRLRPGVLADLGLLSALSSLASELTSRTGVRVTRGFAPGLPQLSAAAELVVYRVAQEALTNVARHAHANGVEVGLSRRGNQLVLRVADDGRGAGSFEEGAGIQGMRERAQMAGGRLELSQRPGGGTVVELELPVVAP